MGKRYIKEIGKDTMSLEDFQGFMAKHWTDLDVEELAEAFKVFDREGNGTFSGKEFRHVMINLCDKLKPEEMDQIMKECNATSGSIKIEEFANNLQNTVMKE